MLAFPCLLSLVVVSKQEGQAGVGYGSARVLAEHVQATLMPPVEQLLLVDYPLRSPPAADVAEPGQGFKLDEVSISLKVGLLLSVQQQCNCSEAGRLEVG